MGKRQRARAKAKKALKRANSHNATRKRIYENLAANGDIGHKEKQKGRDKRNESERSRATKGPKIGDTPLTQTSGSDLGGPIGSSSSVSSGSYVDDDGYRCSHSSGSVSGGFGAFRHKQSDLSVRMNNILRQRPPPKKIEQFKKEPPIKTPELGPLTPSNPVSKSHFPPEEYPGIELVGECFIHLESGIRFDMQYFSREEAAVLAPQLIPAFNDAIKNSSEFYVPVNDGAGNFLVYLDLAGNVSPPMNREGHPTWTTNIDNIHLGGGRYARNYLYNPNQSDHKSSEPLEERLGVTPVPLDQITPGCSRWSYNQEIELSFRKRPSNSDDGFSQEEAAYIAAQLSTNREEIGDRRFIKVNNGKRTIIIDKQGREIELPYRGRPIITDDRKVLEENGIVIGTPLIDLTTKLDKSPGNTLEDSSVEYDRGNYLSNGFKFGGPGKRTPSGGIADPRDLFNEEQVKILSSQPQLAQARKHCKTNFIPVALIKVNDSNNKAPRNDFYVLVDGEGEVFMPYDSTQSYSIRTSDPTQIYGSEELLFEPSTEPLEETVRNSNSQSQQQLLVPEIDPNELAKVTLEGCWLRYNHMSFERRFASSSDNSGFTPDQIVNIAPQVKDASQVSRGIGKSRYVKVNDGKEDYFVHVDATGFIKMPGNSQGVIKTSDPSDIPGSAGRIYRR
jgi:hypothetical protein